MVYFSNVNKIFNLYNNRGQSFSVHMKWHYVTSADTVSCVSDRWTEPKLISFYTDFEFFAFAKKHVLFELQTDFDLNLNQMLLNSLLI